MKTKVTILGESTVEQPKKKIEFVKSIGADGNLCEDTVEPKEWQNIILLTKNYCYSGFDLMFAYQDKSDNGGYLYLGHFNDGVV